MAYLSSYETILFLLGILYKSMDIIGSKLATSRATDGLHTLTRIIPLNCKIKLSQIAASDQFGVFHRYKLPLLMKAINFFSLFFETELCELM